MVSESRLQIAEHKAQGLKNQEIVDRVPGINSVESVTSALQHPDVREQIAFHRDNLFEQSRIDRVQLLRELYIRATQPTGPIFKTLRGEGDFLNANNLEKLEDYQSRLIQQIEVEPSTVWVDDRKQTVSVVKKIRFHSPDAALKILSKAAGFEDGLPPMGSGEGEGPFRGLIIKPPTETVHPEEGPPEKPKHQ